MGKDLIHKRCLGDKVRYADLLNGLLFGGRQEILPDDVQEPDSPTASVKARDIVKKVACGTKFAVIGVENQEKVHYAMPFRSMYYDAMEYERQLRIHRKQVQSTRQGQEEKDAGEFAGVEKQTEEKLTDAEYLSGFRKNDKLMPCITLVLYYGDDWDGGKELADILDMSDLPPELRKYVNNYPMHLFEVKKFADGDTDVFKTDLKQIFDFIRCSKDKEKLLELVSGDPAYQKLDEDAYDMMLAYANDSRLVGKKGFYGKDGKVNMCKAIEELVEDKLREGMERGIEQGLKAFILDHQEDGTPRSRVAEKLMRRFGMNEEQAEEYLVKLWQ